MKYRFNVPYAAEEEGMISANKSREFTNKVLLDKIQPIYFLDEAIEWIQANMEIEDVFTRNQLEKWAKDNNFIEDLIE